MGNEETRIDPTIATAIGVPTWVTAGEGQFDHPDDQRIVAKIAALAHETGGVADIDPADIAERCGLDSVFVIFRFPVLLAHKLLRSEGRGERGWRVRVPDTPPPGWDVDPPPHVA